jgi:hypothetical protein
MRVLLLLLLQLGLSLAAVKSKEVLQRADQQQQQMQTAQHRDHPLRPPLLRLLLMQLRQGNQQQQQQQQVPHCLMQTVQVCQPLTPPPAAVPQQQAGRQASLPCRRHRHPQQQQPRQPQQRSWHVAGASAVRLLLLSPQITACQGQLSVPAWRQQTLKGK